MHTLHGVPDKQAHQRARHGLQQLDADALAATATLERLTNSYPWPFVNLIDAIQDRLVPAVPPLPAVVAASGDGIRGSVTGQAGSAQMTNICADTSRLESPATTHPQWLRQVVGDGLDDYCVADRMKLPCSIRTQTLDSVAMCRNGETRYRCCSSAAACRRPGCCPVSMACSAPVST